MPTKRKNTREEDVAEVKAMWNEAAERLGGSTFATTHDRLARNLEIDAILKYIPEGKKKLKVLDLGCGNGFSTITFVQAREHAFVGIDFSEKMIAEAEKSLKRKKKSLKGEVSFEVGDALDIRYPNGTFDIVTTGRCLVNLVSLKDQKAGLMEIHRVLKKGGHAILSEGSRQGFEELNGLRKLAGLPLMQYHWHNIYLDETKLVPFMAKHFKVKAVDAFAATYFVASRVFNALASKDPKKPDYFSKINKAATKMPAIGTASSLKVFYLQKT